MTDDRRRAHSFPLAEGDRCRSQVSRAPRRARARRRRTSPPPDRSGGAHAPAARDALHARSASRLPRRAGHRRRRLRAAHGRGGLLAPAGPGSGVVPGPERGAGRFAGGSRRPAPRPRHSSLAIARAGCRRAQVCGEVARAAGRDDRPQRARPAAGRPRVRSLLEGRGGAGRAGGPAPVPARGRGALRPPLSPQSRRLSLRDDARRREPHPRRHPRPISVARCRARPRWRLPAVSHRPLRSGTYHAAGGASRRRRAPERIPAPLSLRHARAVPAGAGLPGAGGGRDRVVLGSDHPFWLGDPVPTRIVREAGLSLTAEAAILGDNAARLFGLPR